MRKNKRYDQFGNYQSKYCAKRRLFNKYSHVVTCSLYGSKNHSLLLRLSFKSLRLDYKKERIKLFKQVAFINNKLQTWNRKLYQWA